MVAADAELSQGLEQCQSNVLGFHATRNLLILQQWSIHQANYAKIASLRATSEGLDAQIRDTLRLLTHHTQRTFVCPLDDILFKSKSRRGRRDLVICKPVPANLLGPQISEKQRRKTTQIRVMVGPVTPRESGSQTQTNGTSTPVAGINGVGSDGPKIQGDWLWILTVVLRPRCNPSRSQPTSSQTALPAHWIPLINPESEMKFIPWPSEDTIRRGALASIEILINKGIDPRYI